MHHLVHVFHLAGSRRYGHLPADERTNRHRTCSSSYACICLVIVAFIYSYFNQIKQVEVTADKVVIRKVYGAITIPRKEILYARHRKTLTRAIKSWGVYGLFGLTGEFWEDKTGQFTVAVKDTQSLIEIKTSNKCYVVSCDRYEEVLKLLE